MPAQLQFQQLTYLDAQGQTLLQADFAQPVGVKQQWLPLILAQLRQFGLGKSVHQVISRLVIQSAGQTFTITRDYIRQTNQIDPNPGAELTSELAKFNNPYVFCPQELRGDVPGQLMQLIQKAPTGATAQLVSERKQELLAKGAEQVAKYLELDDQIDTLETELSAQRRVDDSVLNLGQLETELAKVQAQTKSVQNLIQKQMQINSVLAKYGGMLQRDLEAESVQLKQQIRQLRDQELLDTSEKVQKMKASTLGGGEEVKAPWMASYLGLLAMILFLLGAAAFLLTQNMTVLVLTVIATFIEVVVWIGLNYFPAEVDTSEVALAEANIPVISTGSNVQSPIQGMLGKLEKFFVDKAWINALRSESQLMSETINAQLSGQDAQALQTAQIDLQESIQTLKTDIEKFRTQEIPPQQYLQKRRELDTLNLEKARVERDLRALPNYDEVSQLLEQYREAQLKELRHELPFTEEFHQATGLTKLHLDEDGNVTVEQDDSTRHPPTNDEAYQLVVYAYSQEWERSPVQPFIVVDLLTNATEQLKLLWNSRLEHLRQLGQVIQIDTLP